MKMYYCNPVNIDYRYQIQKSPYTGKLEISREAADPSMIYFKGRYYIFASMTLGVWVSDDLVHWGNRRLPDNLPLYDYAPDVRQIGEYVYFSASKNKEACHFYRTKDILEGPYEELPGGFAFWDPNLFQDEDGRIYFYWGCSNETPIWGVELDPASMEPIGEKAALIFSDPAKHGYETGGEDHGEPPRSREEVDDLYHQFLEEKQLTEEMIPQQYREAVRGMFTRKPFIEGAWMNKFGEKYYLQYACSGTEFNIYGDGVYVADHPLGPFYPAVNNPYSYHPGGFLPGAGHGSTMWDRSGNLWHASTMRISVNHRFERRVGIWPAGLDGDGDLFCSQRYGDWPLAVEDGKLDPWQEPQWFLLSYGKPADASSWEDGKEPSKAADENVRTWWRAGTPEPGQWLMLDLGEDRDVRAIQVNFADDKISVPVSGEFESLTAENRCIETAQLRTRWVLEGSADGKKFFILEDKSDTEGNLPHDLIVREDGIRCRFIRLTVLETPYGQNACISELRVFGIGPGGRPRIPEFTAARTGDTCMELDIVPQENVTGYNILWGHGPDKLYHSYMIFRAGRKEIRALVKETGYYVRVDAFNEAGITHGQVKSVE